MSEADLKAAVQAGLNESIEPIPGSCGAKSKRNPWPCKKRPMAGETRCRFHGGAAARANRGKPNKARTTHGLRGKFLSPTEAGYYERAMRDIKATDGAEVLADSAAFVLAKVAGAHERDPNLANTPESADALLRAESVIGRQLEARARILSEQRAAQLPTAPVFQFTTGAETFVVRVGDGDTQARAMLDPSDASITLVEFSPGQWSRALGDENEVYRPLLEAGE